MKKLIIFASLIYSLHATESLAVSTGDAIPDCQALSNTTFNTNRGKVILIDFWATWCPPCKQSMPFLNELHQRQAEKGFEVIAINVDEISDDAKRYLQDHPVDYPNVFDPAGDCPAKFDVKAMPSSYLVDKTGKIRKVYLGFREDDKTEIADSVASALKE